MANDPGARRADGGLTRKGAQTRQKIVAAAAGLILEQGVAGTTLEEVRAAAGVSSSQIYHYYADKEALVRAVVDYRSCGTVEFLLAPDGSWSARSTSRRWPRSRASTACGPGGT